MTEAYYGVKGESSEEYQAKKKREALQEEQRRIEEETHKAKTRAPAPKPLTIEQQAQQLEEERIKNKRLRAKFKKSHPEFFKQPQPSKKAPKTKAGKKIRHKIALWNSILNKVEASGLTEEDDQQLADSMNLENANLESIGNARNALSLTRQLEVIAEIEAGGSGRQASIVITPQRIAVKYCAKNLKALGKHLKKIIADISEKAENEALNEFHTKYVAPKIADARDKRRKILSEAAYGAF